MKKGSLSQYCVKIINSKIFLPKPCQQKKHQKQLKAKFFDLYKNILFIKTIKQKKRCQKIKLINDRKVISTNKKIK